MRNQFIREIAVPVAVLVALDVAVVVVAVWCHLHGLDLRRMAL